MCPYGKEPPAAGAEAEEAEAGSGAVDLGLDMGECVELLEKLGTPQGELQNDYLDSRRPGLEDSLASAESSPGVVAKVPEDPKVWHVVYCSPRHRVHITLEHKLSRA
jgi:hypothetical protein